MPDGCSHITVCICTYRRAHYLIELLNALLQQHTDGEFTFDIVVVDNDQGRSAEILVKRFADSAGVNVSYVVEPQPNIARARNCAVALAQGTYIAFIDDDEIPDRRWLLELLRSLVAWHADGVLGPVLARFLETPPGWLVQSGLAERRRFSSGTELKPKDTRTGNALLTRETLQSVQGPFREKFARGGEDDDFFGRAIALGRVFKWCDTAVVWEVVPPERCTRRYYLKRARLRGENQRFHLTPSSILKSSIACFLYFGALPVLFIFSQSAFMSLLVRFVDHGGKLLSACGLCSNRSGYLVE